MTIVSTDAINISSAVPTLARAARALLAAGRIDEAREALELSTLLDAATSGNGAAKTPGAEAVIEARFDLANLLHAQGRYAEAASQYLALIEKAPGHAEARYNLGVTEMLRGRFAEAISSYRETLSLDPGHTNAHNNLGILLDTLTPDAGSKEEALNHFWASGSAQSRYNLGLTLQEAGRTDAAIELYRRLLVDHPEHLEARNNLGNIALAAGRADDALAEYNRILLADPNFPEAHWNRAMAELLLGNLQEGFRGYEWRSRQKNHQQRLLAAPLWDGSRFDGRTLLIHAEQGLGDTIQFARFLPLVAALGGSVILESQRPLAELLASLDGAAGVIPRGAPLPSHDLHSPMMSLPYWLGTTLETLPRRVPYLSADALRIDRWRRRMEELSPDDELRVGVAWAGNPGYKDNEKRSIAPSLFEIFAGIDGVRWFGLQKDQSGTRIPGLRIEWLEGPGTTFTDAAAIVQNLDLVISVDTSIAHLAGALAKPVWLLASYAPDWRWMQRREDSPWYPTMRLFRQPQPGDWRTVLARVRSRLASLTTGRSSA